MRSKLGTLLMALGGALVLAALALVLWNQREAHQAAASVEEILPQMLEYVAQPPQEEAVQEDEGLDMEWGDEEESDQMTQVEIDGNLYIGYLSIPTLDLELPVMARWDYAQLKIAPCRYTGSTESEDLVICAHNYARHFGTIKNLTVGDAVYFTDMDGVVSGYEVVSVEILEPTAVEEMTDSGYALTLFTCTYGGASRVTVRCNSTAGTP